MLMSPTLKLWMTSISGLMQKLKNKGRGLDTLNVRCELLQGMTIVSHFYLLESLGNEGVKPLQINTP